MYGDTQEIIEDCLEEMEPFMEKVLSELHAEKFYDCSDVDVLEIVAEKLLPAA